MAHSIKNDGSEYTAEQCEWIKAIDRWRQKHRRIPKACDILRIAKELGYRRECDCEHEPGRCRLESATLPKNA